MQDGSQDLVDCLNLLNSEANDFHGISDSFKVSTVIYRRLQDGKENLGELRSQTKAHPDRLNKV